MLIKAEFSGILQWGYLTIMVINLFFVFEFYCKKSQELLLGVFRIGIILLFINIISIMIFPRGIIQSTFWDIEAGDYYFLGIKTQFTNMIFPTLAAIIVLYNNNKSKYRKSLIFFIICAVLNIFLKDISTAIVGLIVFIAILLLGKICRVRINYKTYLSSAIAFQFAVVFFNLQNLFSSLISAVLNKDASLSARVYIWNNAKEVLENQPLIYTIFGNGVIKHNEFVWYSGGYWQPHNQLLVWLYSGGVIGTVLIIYFFGILMKNRIKPNRSYGIVLIVCFLELFLSVTEVYFDNAVCYVPFLIIYYLFNKPIYEKERGV
ncbi:MAG: O-antigen ligase family protein [Methanobacteriaceae archaeon]|nr:O-antigen ligase family protein [Methanobacteriaceae archaeon]